MKIDFKLTELSYIHHLLKNERKRIDDIFDNLPLSTVYKQDDIDRIDRIINKIIEGVQYD